MKTAKKILAGSVAASILCLGLFLASCSSPDNNAVPGSQNATDDTSDASAGQYIVPANSQLKDFINKEAIFPLGNNWNYSTDSGEKDKYIEGIYAALFEEFVNLFGEDVMTYQPVIIYNNPNKSNPVTSPLGNVTVITLSLDETLHWSQLIFQLSHEMMHYVYFSRSPDADLSNCKEQFSTWNEEIICEAMSLYMLDYMADNWDKCALSKQDASYDASIREYLNDEYNDWHRLPLKNQENRIYSLEEFQLLSDQADVTAYRDNHTTERNYLHDLLVFVDAAQIKELLRLYDFYDATYDTIDYISWQQESDNSAFVEKVSAIQPKLSQT